MPRFVTVLLPLRSEMEMGRGGGAGVSGAARQAGGGRLLGPARTLPDAVALRPRRRQSAVAAATLLGDTRCMRWGLSVCVCV